MYEDIIAKASLDFGIPIPWIDAVIQVESGWIATAKRLEPTLNDASYGLMQLLGATAKSLGFTGDVTKGLFDPTTNIRLGTQYLKNLRVKWGDDFRRVYSAYNSGNPDLWQTSTQVASNVQKAMTALEAYTVAAVGTLSGAGTFVGILIVGALLYSWGKRH